MKNKLLSFTLLALLAIGLSSCFSSRSKYGCPSTAYQYKASVKS